MVSPTLRWILTGCWVAVVLSGSALSGEEPEHNLTLAEIAFAEGVWAFEEGADQVAAEKFQESLRNDPRNGTPRYWLGLALLRLGQGREAVREIQDGLMARLPAQVDSRRALADLGAAQLAAGDARAAAETLVKALALKNDDAGSLYRYGETLRLLGRRDEGDAAIARAVGLDPGLASGRIPILPPETRGELSPIDRRPLWEGTLGLTLGGDSNPHLLSEELALPLPGPPPQKLVNGSNSDTVSEVDLRVRFQPLYRPQGWSAAVSLDAGQSFHRDFDYLDLARMRVFVHLVRGADPQGYLSGPLGPARVPLGDRRFSTLVQGGASYYQLNGTSYLRTWDGAASFIFHRTPATSTQLDLIFSDREFSGEGLGSERRSGQDLSLRLGQVFFFGPRTRYLRLTALAGDRSAGRAFSASVVEGSAELALPLVPRRPRWTLQMGGSVREDKFDHKESNLFSLFGPPREDTTVRATAALVWESSLRLRWTARGTYVDRRSNVDLGPGLPDLDYKRTIVSLGMSWVF